MYTDMSTDIDMQHVTDVSTGRDIECYKNGALGRNYAKICTYVYIEISIKRQNELSQNCEYRNYPFFKEKLRAFAYLRKLLITR